MPLLRAIMAAAGRAGSIDDAGASLIYGPDYEAVLAALLATPAGAASGAGRRPGSPLRAVATHTPERPSRGGGETGRAPPAPPRQAGALRAVADSRPAPRSKAAPALQRADIAGARAELRRGRFSGDRGDVAPAAVAMERRAEDGAGGRGTPRRPAAAAAPPGIGHGRVPDPGDGGGTGRGAADLSPATAAPRPAAYRHPADARADLSPEPAETRAVALRAAALALGATMVEDAPAGHEALTDRAAGPGRDPPGPPAGGRRERAVADSEPAARSRAAPASQRGGIAKARTELRRGRFSGGHGDVAPAATAMERRAADGTVGPRPAAGRGTPGRPAEAPPDFSPAAAEPMPAAYRHRADARADVSPEPAEARAAAHRAAALARGATIVEDAPAGPAALTDRVAGPRRGPPGPAAGRGREGAADTVAGAAPVAAAPAPIAPLARHSPDAAGAVSPGRGEPARRAAVSPPAVRHDPAKLDDAGTALAEAAWRNGVDAA